MPTPREWSAAFARQAASDLTAYNLLATLQVPDCQHLHFLQMACEKLAKAHLIAGGADPDSLRAHDYTAGTVPVVLRQQLGILGDPRAARALHGYIDRLADQIEVLAPAVDRDGKCPENCEYPWVDGLGRVWTPAEFEFTAQQLIDRPQWARVLKLIAEAIDRLTEDD